MIKTFKRYEDLLYTIDLVCHGVPSPDFFAGFYHKLKKQIPNLVSYHFVIIKTGLFVAMLMLMLMVPSIIATFTENRLFIKMHS